jgi:hypothetical protein
MVARCRSLLMPNDLAAQRTTQQSSCMYAPLNGSQLEANQRYRRQIVGTGHETTTRLRHLRPRPRLKGVAALRDKFLWRPWRAPPRRLSPADSQPSSAGAQAFGLACGRQPSRARRRLRGSLGARRTSRSPDTANFLTDNSRHSAVLMRFQHAEDEITVQWFGCAVAFSHRRPEPDGERESRQVSKSMSRNVVHGTH